jgi:hypothetical protein
MSDGVRAVRLRTPGPGDPAFHALLTGSSSFDDLPDVTARIADGRLPALCHTIAYDEE